MCLAYIFNWINTKHEQFVIKSKYFHATGHRYYKVNESCINNEQNKATVRFHWNYFTQVINTVREKRMEEKAVHRNTWINFTSIIKFICFGTLAIGICSNFSCTSLKVWISKEDYNTKQSVLIFHLVPAQTFAHFTQFYSLNVIQRNNTAIIYETIYLRKFERA